MSLLGSNLLSCTFFYSKNSTSSASGFCILTYIIIFWGQPPQNTTSSKAAEGHLFEKPWSILHTYGPETSAAETSRTLFLAKQIQSHMRRREARARAWRYASRAKRPCQSTILWWTATQATGLASCWLCSRRSRFASRSARAAL